jgi:hypothetical protein
MIITEPVPWGRTLAEYRAMFALGSVDRSKQVLDVAAGPASFTAEWATAGGRAIACDPLYALDQVTIRGRLAGAQVAIGELMAANAARFVWRSFPGPEALFRARLGRGQPFPRRSRAWHG